MIMNNTEHGSQPIKNEQLETRTAILKKYSLDHQEEDLHQAMIEYLDSQRHPLSLEDIERAAKEYAESHRLVIDTGGWFKNKADDFIAGANFAKQPPKTRKIK